MLRGLVRSVRKVVSLMTFDDRNFGLRRYWFGVSLVVFSGCAMAVAAVPGGVRAYSDSLRLADPVQTFLDGVVHFWPLLVFLVGIVWSAAVAWTRQQATMDELRELRRELRKRDTDDD